MTSSLNEHNDDGLFSLDPKSEAVAHFVTLVGSQLQEAFLERKAKEHMTFQAIANALDLDRSRIHRCLSGHSNLTLETVAELVWALRGVPQFTIELEDDADRNCNHFSDNKLVGNAAQMSGTTGSNTYVTTGSPAPGTSVLEPAN